MSDTEAVNAPPDYAAIKEMQNATWSAGDYGKVGVTLQIVGEQLAEHLDLPPDSKVLDVAAGNGNVTLALARRFCDVTSTDYVDSLLRQGRNRADAEGLDVVFEVADAEDLPYSANTFDAVVSTFGVMFTPNQQQAARELLRVCRPGGKIGMANWTQEGFIGQLFKTIGQYIPAPKGVNSPALWGTREWIEGAFADSAKSLSHNMRDFVFHYRSPRHFIEFFRAFYGPMQKAFLTLDREGQVAFENDLSRLICRFNSAAGGTMRVPSQYAEIIITKA